MDAVLLLSIALAAASAEGGAPHAFIRHSLGLQSYRSARYDLNGDGRKEAVVLATDRGHCGSGGCAFYILSQRQGRWQVVSRSTVTRTPVRVLASETHGWRDLSVAIGGGGGRSGLVRLRYDGRRYPSNPTVLPIAPPVRATGALLIAD
jgi:putative lipoprotein